MLEYKTYRKLIRRYLDDERAVARLFQTRNIIPKNLMYSLFLNWAEDKTKIKYKSKQVFFEEVLCRPEYYERNCWGKDCFVNRKIAPTGTGTGLRTAIVF